MLNINNLFKDEDISLGVFVWERLVKGVVQFYVGINILV